MAGLTPPLSCLYPHLCLHTIRKKITARKITLLRLLWHHGLLMLLVSGDIQVNPGPGTQNYKYPCGTCLKPVKSNQMGICCESCNIWYHLRCLPDSMAISRVEYDLLSNSDKDWHCFSCSTPYFSDSFFDREPPLSDNDNNEPGSDASNSIISDTDSTANTDCKLTTVLGDIRNDSPKDLIVGYLNINSLRHKIIHIREALKRTPVDILGIAETKLDQTFPDAQFTIENYRIFRKDRNQYGGGLITYIRSDIPCRRIKDYETQAVEMLSIEVTPTRESKWIFLISYKPRNVPNSTFTEEMGQKMDRIQVDYSKVCIIGDLNFDLLDPSKSNTLRFHYSI